MNLSHLTNDQLSAVLAAADNTLYCCGCLAKADGEGNPLPYEPELVEVLTKGWGQASPEAVEKATAFLAANGGDLTDQEIDNVMELLSDHFDKQFTTQVRDDVTDLFATSYQFAKREILDEAGLTVSFNFVDDDAVKWLQDHHMYWVDNYYDRLLSEKLREQVADGVRDGLGRADIGERLKTFFDDYPGISSKPAVYWRGLAANGMNRSRNFGLISGYDEVGVTEFQIVAVMDERTSPICFAPWTLVSTPRGQHRIDELKAGDLVITGGGEPSRIMVAGWRVSHSWVSISLSCGRQLTVTHEHPILTTEGWRAAGDIKEDDCVVNGRHQLHDLRKLQSELPEREISRPEVLQPQVLSRGAGSQGVDEPGMCALRKYVSSPEMLCRGGSGESLQRQVQTAFRKKGNRLSCPDPEVQDMREDLQNKTDRDAKGERSKTLLSGMSPPSKYYYLSELRSGIRVPCPSSEPSKILFGILLSARSLGIKARNVGRRDPEGSRRRVSNGGGSRLIFNRLRPSASADCNRSRRRVLAWSGRAAGEQKPQGESNLFGRTQADPDRGKRIGRSAGEKTVEQYIANSSGTSRVCTVKKIQLSMPAYNLEVENDPTYLAEGVIVHNCRELNGKKFSLESAKSQRDQLIQAQSPDSVKEIAPWPSAESVKGQPASVLSGMGISMPPYHFHCRTTIVAA